MPLPKERVYTSKDYWNLPEGHRAELINGQFYDMAPPSRIHQKLVSELTQTIGSHIKSKGGGCEVYPAPFAVNLDAEDKNWVEPDISVICDKNKLTDSGCLGAPDLIIEVVSPSSRKMDYVLKNALYDQAGVKEYWIVDPLKKVSTVYRYLEDNSFMAFYPFDTPIPGGIFDGLVIKIANLLTD